MSIGCDNIGVCGGIDNVCVFGGGWGEYVGVHSGTI